MSRRFKIAMPTAGYAYAESEEELKKRLQTARLGNQKEKLQMLWWLKTGQVKEQQQIGERLGRGGQHRLPPLPHIDFQYHKGTLKNKGVY
ncbi:MAG: hypothetical protein ACYT04_72955 [Nostoc sp.]